MFFIIVWENIAAFPAVSQAGVILILGFSE